MSRSGSIPAVVLVVLALVPVALIAREAILTARNIAQWDDYQQVLELILKDQDRAPGTSMFAEVVSENSGHRTVVSRLIVLAAHRVFGGINFDALGALGWGWLLGACAILVANARGAESRVRLTVLLGFGLFTLQHYESFLWGGSSIDHFAVILMASASFALIAGRWRHGWLAGMLFAFIGSFTLAHGLAIWPVGALMLAQRRRGWDLAIWSAAAALTVAIYFTGITPSSMPTTASSLPGVLGIVHFWLTLLGTPATPGFPTAAPWMGLVLIATTGFRLRFLHEEENFTGLAVTLWALLSAALIAGARAGMFSDAIQSRYLILGSIAWVLNAAWLLDRSSTVTRPYRLVAAGLPALAAFVWLANSSSAETAATFIEQRDRAALSYNRYGEDGRGSAALHPFPGIATEILHRCDQCGIYRFPALCHAADAGDAAPSGRIAYGIERRDGNERSISIAGWAAIPGQPVRRGEIELLLRSETESRVWTTVQTRRGDLVEHYQEPGWRLAGFQLVIPREELPAGRYLIGIRLANGGNPEFTMTDEILDNEGSAPTYARGYEVVPAMCLPRDVHDAQPSGRIAYFVENIEQTGRFLSIQGWAGIPDQPLDSGMLSLVFQTEDGRLLAFSVLQKPRPDVVASMSQPRWNMPGFQLILERSQLPTGLLTMGFLITRSKGPEYILTDHQLNPVDASWSIAAAQAR